MTEPWRHAGEAPPPRQVVGRAIQDLTAARLGRAFVPLGILALLGLVQLFPGGLADGAGIALVLGAPAACGGMLAYGLRVTQRAFGRPPRVWMAVALLGGVLPPLFGLYVLGWLGLRALAGGQGGAPLALAILFTSLGVWVLRSWMSVLEVERLARAMAANIDEYGGTS